jgi:hypothetical protein
MVDWRNRAMEKYCRGGAATERRRQGNRYGPKRALRQARAVLKQAVRKAKSDWVLEAVAGCWSQTQDQERSADGRTTTASQPEVS